MPTIFYAIAILVALATPPTAQDGRDYQADEDAPWPSGKISTQIGDLTFENGYPSDETAEALYDAMDFQRASQAYIWALPLVSFADWKHEWRKQGAGDFDILVMQSFDQKHGLITPNMTTPYYIAFTDLNETGPLVVESARRRHRRRGAGILAASGHRHRPDRPGRGTRRQIRDPPTRFGENRARGLLRL